MTVSIKEHSPRLSTLEIKNALNCPKNLQFIISIHLRFIMYEQGAVDQSNSFQY